MTDLEAAMRFSPGLRTAKAAELFDSSGCKKLPAALAVCLYDAVREVGADTAIRALQTAMKVPVTGIIDQQTITVAFTTHEADNVGMFIALREKKYYQEVHANPAASIFLNQKIGRLRDLRIFLKKTFPLVFKDWKAISNQDMYRGIPSA